MPHPNEVVIRKLYEAAGSGDASALQGLFAPTIVWHEPGKNPTAGDYRGVEEFMGFFGRVFELSGGSFGIEVHDVLANDGHVVGLVVASAQRDGKNWAAREVNVFHLEEGKITEFWNHPGDQYAKDEFWS
jgi:ketosteroid isomerase-like protein